MEWIVQFVLDRIKYYETMEKAYTMHFNEDLLLIVEMLKKANWERLKPWKKSKDLSDQ